MRKWEVILRLGKLPIPEKVEYARFVVDEMTGNAFFPTPIPPLAQITSAIDELQEASLAAVDGPKSKTAVMYNKEYRLDVLLTFLGSYVQFTANTTPKKGEEIIFSAGMDVKGQGGAKPRVFEVRNASIAGKILALTASAGRNAAYKWQYTLTPDIEDNWVDLGPTVVAQKVIEGLTPGQRYYFRVAAITSAGQGPWQGPVDIIVT